MRGMQDRAEVVSAFHAGDMQRTQALSRRALEAARASGDAAAEVDALCWLARVELAAHDYKGVERLAAEGAAIATRSGDLRNTRMPLHLQAAAARMAGDLPRARALYERSIDLNRELGEAKMVAGEQRNLAYVELSDGHERRAVDLLVMARAGARESGYASITPYLVADAAVIAAIDGDPVAAARLLATAESALAAMGRVPDPDEAVEQRRLRERLVAALGPERFATAYDAGRGGAVDEALGSV